jgi:threonine/homoserine/homoserine lactone efflux protein
MTLFGISNFGLFTDALLLLNVTPGPDTSYIVGRSVAQCRNAGLMAALGISVGCCMHVLASALGPGAILATSATAFMLIKLTGTLARQVCRNPKLRLWLERMVGSAFLALGAKLAFTRN